MSQTDLHYNVSSLLKHCLIVIQSVQAPSARIFPKPGKGGQFQSSGREINEESAFTHMEVMLGKCRNDWITTSNPNTTYLGLEPQRGGKGSAAMAFFLLEHRQVHFCQGLQGCFWVRKLLEKRFRLGGASVVRMRPFCLMSGNLVFL